MLKTLVRRRVSRWFSQILSKDQGSRVAQKLRRCAESRGEREMTQASDNIRINSAPVAPQNPRLIRASASPHCSPMKSMGLLIVGLGSASISLAQDTIAPCVGSPPDHLYPCSARYTSLRCPG